MTLTQDVKPLLVSRARASAGFRKALLTEAIRAMLEDDAAVAKTILRDYIVANMGFPQLEAATGLPRKSLMRMLSTRGNPTLENVMQILAAVQKHEGVRVALSLRRAS